VHVSRLRRPSAFLFSLAVAAALAGCAEAPAPPAKPLAAALDAFVTRYASEHPVWATNAGMHGEDGRLDDLSPAAIASRLAWLRATRREFEGFADSTLTSDERVDQHVILARIDADCFDLEELRAWQTSPLLYTRLVAEGVQPLLSSEPAMLDARLAALGARLRQVPASLARARTNLQHVPRVQVDAALRQCAALEDLVGDGVTAAVVPAAAPARAAEVQDAARTAAAAIADFESWLAGILEGRADGDFRLGRERFERRLCVEVQTDWTADEVRQRATQEAQALRVRMYEVALPLWRREHGGHLAPSPATAAGLDSVIVPVLDGIAADHPAPGEILATCTSAVDSLTRFFTRSGLVQQDTCAPLVVAWAPPFARGVTIAGLAPAGRFENARQAAFLVQPVPADWPPPLVNSLLREYNRPTLQVLAMHEAVPGHYVQLCQARRCPHAVRDLFANGAFVEGWAVYAEDFALAAGYGDGDARLRLAQLKFALRSALNAVLDVAVHCDGMTEPQAIALLDQVGFQEEAEARAKWLRVQLSAGNLCTYFVGYASLRDLEGMDRQRAGPAWSRADFVARLLAHGAPPVRELGALLWNTPERPDAALSEGKPRE
jgi:uncharacterized protein (DUF885 family)